VRNNGCALIHFDFIYGDLVCWLGGEYTTSNIDYDTVFDNLNNLHIVQMPPGYSKVDLNQTRETLKEGLPTKGAFTSNFEHAHQQAQYDNHKGMHDHIDVMTEKFANEEEKSYHLCFPRSSFYFIPGIIIALLNMILQKEKFRIMIDPTHAIFDGDIGTMNAQMQKPRIEHHQNPVFYYGKALMRH
jgi:hypothetical protein